MNTELDDLIRQKRDINRQIKLLKSNAVISGSAKVDTQVYPTNLPDRQYLAIKVNKYNPKGFEGFNCPRYVTVFSSTDREEVIDTIPRIIRDLQGLYDKLKGNGK